MKKQLPLLILYPYPALSATPAYGDQELNTKQSVTKSQQTKEPRRPHWERGNKKLYEAGKGVLGVGMGILGIVFSLLLIYFLIIGLNISLIAFFSYSPITLLVGIGSFLVILGGILMKVSGYKPKELTRKRTFEKVARFFLIFGLILFTLPFILGLVLLPIAGAEVFAILSTLPQFLILYAVGFAMAVIALILLPDFPEHKELRCSRGSRRFSLICRWV
jgi:hypothetical protein